MADISGVRAGQPGFGDGALVVLKREGGLRVEQGCNEVFGDLFTHFEVGGASLGGLGE